MATDILMTALLPLLMAYSLIGGKAHEILGIVMFALFIVHHILNWRWWTTIFKGKYDAARVLSTVVNLLLAVFMVLQPVSGILMSKYVLKSVSVTGTASMMRTIHITLAYWGLLLMSFHLGMHAEAIGRKVALKTSQGMRKMVSVIFLIIALYGFYAFWKRGIADYLFMRTMFAFFDFEESRICFFADYIAIMVLAAEAAFWLRRGLAKK